MAGPDLQGAIWAWVQSLPPWQSDLLRRLSVSDHFDQAAVKDALFMFVACFGVPTQVPAPAPEPMPALVSPPQPSSETQIVALSDVKSVGSLETGQRLEFATKGLTVVFGETGSGKSSYARVLRKACRASDRDVEILPNVLRSAAGSSVAQAGTASIEALLDGTPRTITRDVNAPPEPDLARVSVFDADCAGVYADGESEVTYTPSVLRMFQRLVTLQIEIKKRIDDVVGKLEAEPMPVDGFDRNTKAGALALGLTGNVNPDVIRALAEVGDLERQRLEALRTQVATVAAQDPAKAAAELQRRANALARLQADMSALEDGLSITVLDKIADYNGRIAELARRSQELADALSVASTRAVGGAPWKTMWQAAHRYVEHAGSSERFPPDNLGSICPLCLQPLSDEAIARLQRFEEFFRGEVERATREATEARNAQVDAVHRLPDPAALLTQVPVLLGDDAALSAAADAFLRSASTRKTVIRESALATQLVAPPLCPCPRGEMQSKANVLRQKSAELAALAVPQAIASAKHEIAEIENRVRLSERLQPALERIDALKMAGKLRQASSALTTTGLTKRIGEFTESAVTAQLRARLVDELTALRVDHLPVVVGARGAAGKTQVSLHLNTTRKVDVSDVLSEGEQRAVALAFFLAEVAVAEHHGGIVLDDPVSSLDHARRSYVAQRLVEESAKRQTIVFTHDIVLLLEIQELAKRGSVPLEIRAVRRVGDTVGVATKDLPWIAQNVGQRVNYLRNDLQRLAAVEREGAQDGYRREAKIWCELLREAWERAVEEKLFCGVVGRFQPSIKTLALKSLSVTEAMTAAVEEGMTWASAWTHDQAPALNKPAPTAAELKAALDKFDTFVAQFKK